MKKYYWIFLVLYLLLYILPLPFRPLMIPDEFRYAEIPREMMASGHWASPHLNGLHYFEKPVMGYWLTAGSLWLFGQNAFGVRLPSALAAGICAWLVFIFIKRFSSRKMSAVLGAFILLTSLEFFGVGTFAVLDGPLTLFLTLALVCFYSAYQEESRKKRTGWLVLCGLFGGLAFMTKGFLALALPVLAIIPFLAWERRLKDLWALAWPALFTMGLAVLPWAWAIHRSDPDFWRYFFWVEHVQRFFSGRAQHPHPFWYFMPLILAGFLPWSGLLPAVIKGLPAKDFRDPLLRFSVCWFVFPFVFFSASHGKLITYLLPCFPPLAILCSRALVCYLETGQRKLFSIPALLGMITALLAALVIAGSQFTGFLGIKAYGGSETWKWVLSSIALLTGALCMFLSLRTRDPWRRIVLFGAAPLFFFLSAPFILPQATLDSKAPEKYLRKQTGLIGPDTILVSDEKLMHAVCWVYQRDDVFLLERPGEMSYGLSVRNAGWRLLTMQQFTHLVEAEKKRGRVVLFAGINLYSEFARQMPEPLTKEQWGRFIFARF